MSQEKRPEITNWRDRVDELAALPNEPDGNRAVAWNRIQSQLNLQKKSTPIFWYSVAAILVCVVAAIPLMDFNKKANEHPVAIIKNPVTPPKKTTTFNTSSPTSISQTITASKERGKHKGVVQRDKTPFKQDTVSSKPPETLTLTGNSRIQIKEIQGLAIETPTQDIVVESKPVKKLKVLHINEIESGENPTAASERHPGIRINAGSREDLSEAYVQANTADHLIKIKLPQN